MMRGVYASASALFVLLNRQEAMTQNLANMNTPGYKQETPMIEEGPGGNLVRVNDTPAAARAVGPLPFGVAGGELEVDYSQGPLQNTQRPLDLALLGDGFFRVLTPDGERLTRDGSFHRDNTGRLVSADGYFLLGDNGPLQIGEGIPTIVDDGSIFMPDQAQPVGRIARALVADPAVLQREGQNLLNPAGAAVQPAPAGTAIVKQGMLEQSNVDASGTMIGVMAALRSYEAVQRSLKMQDETIQRALEIGRMG